MISQSSHIPAPESPTDLRIKPSFPPQLPKFNKVKQTSPDLTTLELKVNAARLTGDITDRRGRFDEEESGEEGSDALVSLSPSSVCDH